MRFHPIPDDARVPPGPESTESLDTFGQHRLSRRKNVRDSTGGPFESNVRALQRKGTQRSACPDVINRATDITTARKTHQEPTSPAAVHFTREPPKEKETRIYDPQQLLHMFRKTMDRISDDVALGLEDYHVPPEPSDPDLRAFGRHIKSEMDRIHRQLHEEDWPMERFDNRRKVEQATRQACRQTGWGEAEVQLNMQLWDLSRQKYPEGEEWQMEEDAFGLWAYYRCAKFDEAHANGLPYPPRITRPPVRAGQQDTAPTARTADPPRPKPSRLIIYRDGKFSGYVGPRPSVNVETTPCFREEAVLPPQPEVPDASDNDIDNAILVDHIDWESRLQEGSRRRAERQQQSELERERESQPATEQSPSFIGTVIDTAKSWITSAWTTVKTALWG
ncbi:hypothetical protein PRZ48_012713 [Zasmidium cellare]|uniref:Uncharacterized protein n=1 Tax=Zasmidium cellare TaxID=395010 RepID=A0ABR0E5M1_ZASCE|nr:hypothetical protein PRZ48_012713 [Zasmidium cellare]